MAFTKGPNLSLTYEQVEELVSQLSKPEKVRLAKTLKDAGVKADWNSILAALKPGRVSDEEVNRVVKQVRSKRQARLRRESTTGRS